MTPKISQKPVANGLLALFLLGTTPSAISQSDTWSGTSSSDWGTASNWLNGSVPGSADGQSATFDTSVTPGTGNGNVTLSGNVGVGDIIFSGNGSTSYDLGVTGGTLNLADNGDVTVNATVEVNQIISANIVLGDGTATTNQITNLNTTAGNTLLLAGDLIAPANATGTVRMDFGNFNTTLDRIDISGDVYYNGAGAAGADRFDLFLAGANMTLSGNAAVTRDDTSNKVRTYLRYGTVLTVEGANGRLGSGALVNRWGTLNLNNSNSTLRSSLFLGDSTQGDGDAIVNIADGQTMQLFSGINYVADNNNDNQGFINGGNIRISGANRTINIGENANLAANEAELTISGGTLDDDNGTRDVTVIGGGTLSLGLTSAANDRWIFSNPKTILTDDSLGVGRVFVQQRNNANLSNFDVQLDINGQTIDLHENLVLGAGGTNNVAQISTMSVVDSVGTGKLIFNGDNPLSTNPQRQINNNVGSALGADGTTPKRNITSIVDVHVHVNGGTMVFGANDTLSPDRTVDTATGLSVDMDFTGMFSTDNFTRTLQKNSSGTLRFLPTESLYGALNVGRGNLIVNDLKAIGTNDVTLGSNTFDGALYYTGGAGVLTEEFRIGDNNAAATRTGGGSLINNGTGTLKVTGIVGGGVHRFNESRTAVTVNRTLTLGGTSDIEILGAIRDNNTAGNGTISVTKTGTNTVTLLGKANTYTGNTSVNEGLLNINGVYSSNISVASGADLGGEGVTSGDIVFSGNTHSIVVDGTTPGSLGTDGTGQFDLSAVSGVTIDLQNKGGPGAFDIITYPETRNVGFNDTSKFTVINAPEPSSRGAGAGLAFTSTAITFDAGYQAKTWAGSDGTNPTFWDVSTTENWSGGTDNFFVDRDSVTFDDTGSTTVVVQGDVRVGNMTVAPQLTTNDYNISGGNITIDGTMTLAGGNATTSSAGNDIVISSRIIGDGSVLVADGDTINDANQNSVTLSGNNAYTGGTVLGEGKLSITNSNALGTGLVTIDGTNTAGNQQRDPYIDIDANNLNISNDIFFGDNDTKYIRLDNGGAASHSGELSGSIVTSDGSDTATRLDAGRNDVLTVSGKVSGNNLFTRSTYKNGTFEQQGTIVLANANNDFKGNLVIGSIAEVASIGNAGQASHAGAGYQIVLGVNANNSITSNSNQPGTLLYTGSGDSTDKRVQVGNFWFSNNHTDPGIGGTIRNDGTGALVFTNSQFSQVENNGGVSRIQGRTLTLAGSYTGGINQIQGTILDNGIGTFDGNQTVALLVDTDGTWEVSGNSGSANGYSGGTSVISGNLLVNNTAGSGVGFGNVTVGSEGGTASLGGSGTIFADNSTSRNSAKLATRSTLDIGANGTHTAGATTAAGSVGQQTIAGNIVYQNGATVAWDLVANSVTNPGTDYDQFVVNNGGSISFDSALNLEIAFGSGVDFENSFWNTAGTNEWEIWNGTVSDVSAITFSLSEDSAAENEQYFTASAFEISNDNFGGTDTGQGVWLRQLAAIPEPSTFSLLGLGLAGFGWFARRRRNRQSVS